jgi:hypothetical protein
MKNEPLLKALALIGLTLLTSNAVNAQQVAAVKLHGGGGVGANAVTAEARSRAAAEETRAQIPALQKRKSALERYLKTVNPASAEYKTVADSIQAIDLRLRILEKLSESVAPARVAPTSAVVVVSPQDEELTAKVVTHTREAASISVDVTKFRRSQIRVEATDSNGRPLRSTIFRVEREHTVLLLPPIPLAETGDTIITISSIDGKVTTTLTVTASSAGTPIKDLKAGGAVGLMVGGMVVSQQAQNFNQADPFFGFIAGYTSKQRGDRGFGAWRWNLRFQGIFTAAARAAQGANPTPEGGGDGTDGDGDGDGNGGNGNGGNGGTGSNPEDAFKFIASRKSFDFDAHMWIDLWAANAFSIGPYVAWGASAAMDKNELRGEPVIVDNDNDDTEDEQGAVVTESESDNDIKQFREAGVLMNLKMGPDRRLFLQAIIARGWYEALKDLDRDDDTRNRFIGKLRIFPEGLDFDLGNRAITPMFGLEVNAGAGPDQVKFFTGFAVRVKGFSSLGM